MATIVLDAKEFARYHKTLAAGFERAAMRGLRSGAARAVAYLIDRTRHAPPANPGGKGRGGAVNTGEFVRAWRVLNTPEGARLMNDRPYGPIIEKGRRVGAPQPPQAPIARWAQLRLGMSRKDAKAIAFVIARAIKRRGLLGRFILTADEAKVMILQLVREETIRELERAIRGAKP